MSLIFAKPIDLLLIAAETSPTTDNTPVQILYFGRFIMSIAIMLAVMFFFMLNFGSSMQPTLTHFSIGVRIPAEMIGEFERGDIVSPDVKHKNYRWLNKRIVGLPGETITITNGVVKINDIHLSEPYLTNRDQLSTIAPSEVAKEFQTSFKTGCLNYGNMNRPGQYNPYTRVWECQLADDHVFVLGDNRNNSFDIRKMGPVHISKIVSQTVFILFPFSNFGIV